VIQHADTVLHGRTRDPSAPCASARAAGFGAILLTFLAGTEIDPRIVRKHFWTSMTIGVMGFVAPYLGVLAYAHWGIGWAWPQAQIAGIALSTTSVAVVYAVMIETGFNRTELGKIILAACFIKISARYWPLVSYSHTSIVGWCCSLQSRRPY